MLGVVWIKSDYYSVTVKVANKMEDEDNQKLAFSGLELICVF